MTSRSLPVTKRTYSNVQGLKLRRSSDEYSVSHSSLLMSLILCARKKKRKALRKKLSTLGTSRSLQ